MNDIWKSLGGAITTIGVIYLTIKLRHPEKLKWSIGLRNFMLVLVIMFVIWLILFVIIPITRGGLID